ncbi:MAG: tetratricopeptide repeat protein, partial [Planctomycetes bacterium]|nr:tetratricopeptide repeat protein [Planctomycetota bacterium]
PDRGVAPLFSPPPTRPPPLRPPARPGALVPRLPPPPRRRAAPPPGGGGGGGPPRPEGRCATLLTPPNPPLVRGGTGLAVAVLVVLAAIAASARAAGLDEMSLERWKELREVERYQLQIAEGYYREKKWKVAAAEYEKFLTLYERSEGGPYAQLKWSLCQVHLRNLNTAIKDGFQSVIDYWPDSPDAVAAAYFIGRSYKDIGEPGKAKKAHAELLSKHPKHLVSVYAMVDLIDIANVEQDEKTKVELWKKLTFETERTREANNYCVQASQALAAHQFTNDAFDEGVKALETTYNEEQMPYHLLVYAQGPIANLTAAENTKAQGEKLADQAVAYVRAKLPADLSNEELKKRALQYWFYTADLCAASRRAEKVLETYQQIEQKFGASDEMLGRLAGWHKSIAKWDEARQIYGRFQDKIEGANQIAYSFHQQGQYDQAVAAYQQVLALDPQNPVKWKPSIAWNYRHAHKWPQAIAVYEELIRDDVKEPHRWRWEIAQVHEGAGQWKEAIGVYRQCETQFPQNCQRMAECHRRLKEWNEAILLYNQIIGGAPQQAPWALYQIGMTRHDAEQKELAISALQQVCKRFPKDDWASRAHAFLQSEYKINITLGGATDEGER